MQMKGKLRAGERGEMVGGQLLGHGIEAQCDASPDGALP